MSNPKSQKRSKKQEPNLPVGRQDPTLLRWLADSGGKGKLVRPLAESKEDPKSKASKLKIRVEL